MADAAANALIGREGGIEPATFDVGVIITDRALLDPEGADPAVIEGYGTVPPEQLRSELREALREPGPGQDDQSEEHTSELQSRGHLVCRLLLEKKKNKKRKSQPPIDEYN